MGSSVAEILAARTKSIFLCLGGFLVPTSSVRGSGALVHLRGLITKITISYMGNFLTKTASVSSLIPKRSQAYVLYGLRVYAGLDQRL